METFHHPETGEEITEEQWIAFWDDLRDRQEQEYMMEPYQGHQEEGVLCV